MPRIVAAASPAPGHVTPLAQLSAGLVRLGHDVTLLTGSAFREQVEATGAAFARLPAEVDVDFGDIGAAMPGRAERRPGTDQLAFDLAHVFGDPIPAQHAAVQELVTDDDVLVHDCTFLGAWPVLLGAPGRRPRRAIGIGVTPVQLASDDTTPLGPVPAATPEESRLANRAANAELRRALAPAQEHVEGVLRGCGATAEVPFLLDGFVTVPDVLAQLTVPEFEFHRSDAPASLRFAGPLLPPRSRAARLPDWWDELDGDRPVVVVTQGTVANQDLGQLVVPALRALADRDVLVVAALGRAASALREVPANARVAEFVPFAELLPHADVMITNGGYGGTQHALSVGVPVVVGGATEDKPAVAARVAASGAGVDLRTATCTPEQIAAAVTEVMTDPRYRAAARALARRMADSDPVAVVAALIAGD